MCGRINIRSNPRDVGKLLSVEGVPDFPVLFNVAPTQNHPIGHLGSDGQRIVSMMRWGLIPSWAKDLKIGYKLINARSETITEKPSFRSAFKRRRCLVPVSGFYEWLRDGKEKLPYHIHRQDDGLFAFAGLCETWTKGEVPIESFTIITTSANELMEPIHNRMPVLVSPDNYSLWLDHEIDPDSLQQLMQPFEWRGFDADPVSQVVNNARHETSDCLTPRTA